MSILLWTAAGTLMGLLSVLPGVHVSVLLIGLLPLLGVKGLAGGCALAAALGSSLICGVLAKTYHPATDETLPSAPVEQKMAYRGDGVKALHLQLGAVLCALFVVGTVGLFLFSLEGVHSGFVKAAMTVVKPFAFLAILGFLAATYFQAGRKLDSLMVMVMGTLIGFAGTNTPALAGNASVLAPLLAGVFAVPQLLMLLMHKGQVRPIPVQRSPKGSPPPTGAAFFGSFGGMVTALTAGLGSGAAVSLFAGSVREEEYLEMHTASETANSVFAILLFVLAGVTRSGSAVAMKGAMGRSDCLSTILLLFSLLIGVLVACCFVFRVLTPYVTLATTIPQRGVALVVLGFTLGMVLVETGAIGLFVCACATSLGLVARIRMVPNQALATVLTGPVLIYYSGLAHPLAAVLGMVR